MQENWDKIQPSVSIQWFIHFILLGTAAYAPFFCTVITHLHHLERQLACNADNLTAIWADCLENVEALTSDNPVGLHSLLQG
jgi:uncharacterized membrane protein